MKWREWWKCLEDPQAFRKMQDQMNSNATSDGPPTSPQWIPLGPEGWARREADRKAQSKMQEAYNEARRKGWESRNQLYRKLRMEVLTDAEMDRVFEIGARLVVGFANYEPHRDDTEVARINAEFNTALFRQALLRLEVAEARIQKLERMGGANS